MSEFRTTAPRFLFARKQRFTLRDIVYGTSIEPYEKFCILIDNDFYQEKTINLESN